MPWDQLRLIFEVPVLLASIFTLGLLPALVGYVCGRLAPLVIRIVPATWLVLGGYWACKYSDHGFEIYLLGNVLYIAMSAIGIAGRARRLKKRFWEFHHVDWMAVAGATVVYWFLYVPPMR